MRHFRPTLGILVLSVLVLGAFLIACTGKAGLQGPAGPQGAAGAAGAAGPAGPVGPAAAAGARGAAGDAGVAGARGAAGPAGPKGDPGPALTVVLAGPKVRWDIILGVNPAPPAPPLGLRPGGEATARDRAGNKITLTGSGTFVAPVGGSSKLATGGGTWVISGGPDAGSGTYEVTELVSWREAPGTVPLTLVDKIGDQADGRAGQAVLRIKYSDGSLGVLVVSCRTPLTPPADSDRIFEGITVSKGFVWYMDHKEPVANVEGERTLFHVINLLWPRIHPQRKSPQTGLMARQHE
jgi:hypothetical protein